MSKCHLSENLFISKDNTGALFHVRYTNCPASVSNRLFFFSESLPCLDTHYEHRFPAPSFLRKGVVNQCLEFGLDSKEVDVSASCLYICPFPLCLSFSSMSIPFLYVSLSSMSILFLPFFYVSLLSMPIPFLSVYPFPLCQSLSLFHSSSLDLNRLWLFSSNRQF